MQISSIRVARAIARLDLTRRYAKATSDDAVFLHQLSAAQRHGVYEPFSADAQQLNDWLLFVRADRVLCRAAWDSFMEDDANRVSDAAVQRRNSLP